MSKVSIYEKGWINLVFEGKNKEYGAYQLRREDSRTTITAFFFGLLFIVLVSGLGMLLSSFGNKPAIVVPEVPPNIFTVIKLDNPKTVEPKKAVAPFKKNEPKDITKKDLVNPKITSSDKAVDNVNSTKDHLTNPNTSETGSPTGTSTIPTSNASGISGSKPIDNGSTIVGTVALDKLPEFPGGLDKFYNYVGTHFEKPEIEGEKTVNVLVSFVIERDGSMTDIRVNRNPGYGLDKEAIRVLKSLKTKWTPGMINGSTVRTSYNLPITVKME